MFESLAILSEQRTIIFTTTHVSLCNKHYGSHFFVNQKRMLFRILMCHGPINQVPKVLKSYFDKEHNKCTELLK